LDVTNRDNRQAKATIGSGLRYRNHW